MAIGDELANLNFAAMIGGPLKAVVEAQAHAAMTSVEFIKKVGFTTGNDGVERPTMIEFAYTKLLPGADGEPESVQHKLSVPFLTMMPIPFLTIEEAEVNFNAKINSVEESRTFNSDKLDFELGGGGNIYGIAANLKVAYSAQKSSSQGQKTERTYSMNVRVRAAQAEMPEGANRLLSILENVIKEDGPGDARARSQPLPPGPSARLTRTTP